MDPIETIRSLVRALDGALPLMDKEASIEARREHDKPMKCITKKLMAERARKLVEQAAAEFGVHPAFEEEGVVTLRNHKT